MTTYDSFRSTTDTWKNADDSWTINITLESLVPQTFTWESQTPVPVIISLPDKHDITWLQETTLLFTVTKFPDAQVVTFSQETLVPKATHYPSSLTFTWSEQTAIITEVKQSPDAQTVTWSQETTITINVRQLPSSQEFIWSQPIPQVQAIIGDTWTDTDDDAWVDKDDTWFIYGATLTRVQPQPLVLTWSQQTPTVAHFCAPALTFTWSQETSINVLISGGAKTVEISESLEFTWSQPTPTPAYDRLVSICAITDASGHPILDASGQGITDAEALKKYTFTWSTTSPAVVISTQENVVVAPSALTYTYSLPAIADINLTQVMKPTALVVEWSQATPTVTLSSTQEPDYLVYTWIQEDTILIALSARTHEPDALVITWSQETPMIIMPTAQRCRKGLLLHVY